MKKTNLKALLYLFFTIAYATLLSIGMACLLNLFGIALAISLDGGSVVNQYPRFIPFCFVVGLLAFVALILLLVLNIKTSEKFDYTKKIWCAQSIGAFIISIPMTKFWEMLFDFMQKAF